MSWIEQISYLGGWRTLDARGNSVPLYSPTRQTMRLGAEEGFPRSEFEAVLERARPIGRRARVAVYAVLLLQGAVVVRFAALLFIDPTPGAAFGLLFSCVLVLVVLFALRSGIGAGTQRFTEAMLGRGRCPSCGYGLPAEQRNPRDTTVVCSECGSAWHLFSPVPRGPYDSPDIF